MFAKILSLFLVATAVNGVGMYFFIIFALWSVQGLNEY
jgi:hypothetical protein